MMSSRYWRWPCGSSSLLSITGTSAGWLLAAAPGSPRFRCVLAALERPGLRRNTGTASPTFGALAAQLGGRLIAVTPWHRQVGHRLTTPRMGERLHQVIPRGCCTRRRLFAPVFAGCACRITVLPTAPFPLTDLRGRLIVTAVLGGPVPRHYCVYSAWPVVGWPTGRTSGRVRPTLQGGVGSFTCGCPPPHGTGVPAPGWHGYIRDASRRHVASAGGIRVPGDESRWKRGDRSAVFSDWPDGGRAGRRWTRRPLLIPSPLSSSAGRLPRVTWFVEYRCGDKRSFPGGAYPLNHLAGQQLQRLHRVEGVLRPRSASTAWSA